VVVARWSRGGRTVVVAFRLANASFRLLFVCAVVLWWSRSGSVAVARWSHGGRTVVVPSSRGGCCVSSCERLFSSSVRVCGGSVVVA